MFKITGRMIGIYHGQRGRLFRVRDLPHQHARDGNALTVVLQASSRE